MAAGQVCDAFQPPAESLRTYLFQGRYKSLYVDPDGMGSLCHYIHLNPVKAGLVKVQELSSWPWSSFL
jgi:putative transposase